MKKAEIYGSLFFLLPFPPFLLPSSLFLFNTLYILLDHLQGFKHICLLNRYLHLNTTKGHLSKHNWISSPREQHNSPPWHPVQKPWRYKLFPLCLNPHSTNYKVFLLYIGNVTPARPFPDPHLDHLCSGLDYFPLPSHPDSNPTPLQFILHPEPGW